MKQKEVETKLRLTYKTAGTTQQFKNPVLANIWTFVNDKTKKCNFASDYNFVGIELNPIQIVLIKLFESEERIKWNSSDDSHHF